MWHRCCRRVGHVNSSLANVSAISTTHINDTALTVHRDTSVNSSVVPQSTDVIGQQRQPITDLDSVDLTTATREPFLDGCRVGTFGFNGSIKCLLPSTLPPWHCWFGIIEDIRPLKMPTVAVSRLFEGDFEELLNACSFIWFIFAYFSSFLAWLFRFFVLFLVLFSFVDVN